MGLPIEAITRLLPVIVPAALSIVGFVEKLFGGGNGPAKRSLAVELLVVVIRAYEAFSGRELVDEQKLAETLGPIIDTLVKLLNDQGVFKKSA